MAITASKLRENVYRILDNIIQTGKSVEIQRGSSVLTIAPKFKKFQKLSRLRKQKLTLENSDNFEHIDWYQEWQFKR